MVITVIDIGSYAKYPRTGTVGTVTRFHEKHGDTFVELDSTGLLYRIDQVIPASSDERASFTVKDKDYKKVISEQEAIGEIAYADAVFQQDGACHGGG